MRHCLSALSVFLLLVLSAFPALAGGPAMLAFFPNYNQSAVVKHGPHCWNQISSMPAGRQVACGLPALVKNSTGNYTVTVANAAPFPTSVVDSGYQVYVQTVGGTANCFDTGLSSDAAFKLTSNIRCVTPSGSDVDHPQTIFHSQDHGYATVDGTGAIRANESFNPIAPGFITSSRLATGRYTVAFGYMNPQDGNYLPDPDFNVNNVIASKTCVGDNTSACRRAVCIPYAWTLGTATIRDTTVEVRCYDRNDGQARDTNFRVFVGEEAHTSQAASDGDHAYLGEQFGWISWPGNNTTNMCYAAGSFRYRHQHEGPADNPYTLPVSVCKPSTGIYDVFFTNLFYTEDKTIPIVSSRGTGGVFCNVESIDCGGVDCTGATDPRITVKCYNRSGSPINTAFNMSMAYPQWW